MRTCDPRLRFRNQNTRCENCLWPMSSPAGTIGGDPSPWPVSIKAIQAAAWAEVAQTLNTFETPSGFVAPAEVLVAAGVKPG